MARAALAQHEGRFDDALGLGTEAKELAARGGHQAGDFYFRLLAYICRLKTGEGPRDEVMWMAGARARTRWRIFWAMAAAGAGDTETAAALFSDGLARDR